LVVADAVNDMFKAISGSLLMEQVLALNFKFYRREDGDIREPVETDGQGNVMIGIKGLVEPPTDRAKDICEQDMKDLMAAACQAMDRRVLEPDTTPEVATQMVLTDIIEKRYEALDEEETESVRQHLAAHMNILSIARDEQAKGIAETHSIFEGKKPDLDDEEEVELGGAQNTLLQMVKKFINVRDIDVALIDSVNAFREQFEVASKSLDSDLLAHVQSAMVAIRVSFNAFSRRFN